MVGDRRFPVNTTYLSAYSPVFERMFQIEMKEKDAEEVEIKDVTPEHFDDFLAAISPQRIHPNRLFYLTFNIYPKIFATDRGFLFSHLRFTFRLYY